MKRFHKILLLVVVLAVVATAGAWWHLSPRAGQNTAVPSESDKKILYWYDPMVPDRHFDKPGKSPFMDMQLVPKYDQSQSAEGSVSIDPRTVQNMAVRTGKVVRAPLSGRVDAVGYVKIDESKLQVVQARAQGWVERLNVKAVNDPVTQGQLLLELYSPDLLAAQEEYLLVRNSPYQHETEEVLLAAAKDKMQLLGISAAQIRELDETGKASRHIRFYAPANGVVTELGVRQGMQVAPGMNLYSIVDLSSVWVTAEIPESQAARVRQGGRAEITAPALGDKTYRGIVNYVYPQVSPASRTLQVRIRLDNPGGRLKPEMFTNVALFNGEKREVLVVPSEAVIATGRRNVVIVAEGDGKFHPVEVKLGADVGGQTEVLSGLSVGQTVVTSGQFLIDSESNLRAGFERFEATPAEGRSQTSGKPEGQATNRKIHHGQGKVNRIDPSAGKINLSHGPIPALNWPAMTMDFTVADKQALAGVRPGETIAFEFSQSPGGEYVITRIAPGRQTERKP